MIKEIGRLEENDIIEINIELQEFYNYIDEEQIDKAVEKINDLSSSPNYFVREEIGKLLLDYEEQEKIEPILEKMLLDEHYGVRATAIFYFFRINEDDPVNMLPIIEKHFNDNPWEFESIIDDYWNKHPKTMKKEMTSWLEDGSTIQKRIAFQGIENLVDDDPRVITKFIKLSLDDENADVKKKLNHILVQIIKSNPDEIYPHIREWLMIKDIDKQNILWNSMKKIISILHQKSKKDKTPEFITLTNQILQDWPKESNKHLSSFGKKLAKFASKSRKS